MNKQKDARDSELKPPAEAVKDLEPQERETEQVKGGSFSWGASLSSGGDRPSET